ncbi:MAG: hypothetical protein ACRCWJ_18940 [Casimicrobium sp.]
MPINSAKPSPNAAALQLASLMCILVCAGCTTAPINEQASASKNDQTAVDEKCFVTGSRLAKKDCRDSGVGMISREAWERKLGDVQAPVQTNPGM